MTQEELQDTIIVTGRKSAYIAKGNKSESLMSQVRREITKGEILGLITWYSEQKFKNDNCDEYDVTVNGKTVLTIKNRKTVLTIKNRMRKKNGKRITKNNKGNSKRKLFL